LIIRWVKIEYSLNSDTLAKTLYYKGVIKRSLGCQLKEDNILRQVQDDK